MFDILRWISSWILNGILSFGVIRFVTTGLILLNVIAFWAYRASAPQSSTLRGPRSKKRTLKESRRVSEKTLLFWTLFGGGIGAILAMKLLRHKNRKTKFKVLAWIGVFITLIPVIHIGHGLTLGRDVRFVEVEFHSSAWPEALDGYRIAFMTDKHDIPDAEMAEIVEILNTKDLDLLLLGGDFAGYHSMPWHHVGTLREISHTHTRDGIFGVEGNHDYHGALFEAKVRYGIVPLDNEGLYVRDGFYLAGVADLWNRTPDVRAAISGANSESFILLITHNPDVSMQQPTAGIDFIVAGHTHGGQITIFGWPIALYLSHISDYGSRFAGGWAYSKDGVPVFTSVGTGPYYGWPRVFARPEVVIFTMFSE